MPDEAAPAAASNGEPKRRNSWGRRNSKDGDGPKRRNSWGRSSKDTTEGKSPRKRRDSADERLALDNIHAGSDAVKALQFLEAATVGDVMSDENELSSKVHCLPGICYVCVV